MESNEASAEQQPYYAPPWIARLPWPVRAACFVVLMFTPLLAVLVLFNRGKWLPTQAWLEASGTVAMLASLAWAAMMLVVVVMATPPVQHWKDQSARDAAITKKVLWMVLLGLMFHPGIMNIVRLGVPAIHAAFHGEQVAHKFVVNDPDYGHTKFCKDAVSLQDMPSFAELCRVPDGYREKLRPGMTIIVEGKGSWMGVAPEQLRIDDGG
jgi:hypothetical protein